MTRLVVGTVGVGSGRVRTAHGDLPVPVPAVVELLQGFAVTAGPHAHEATTPTGAALVAALADASGPLPTLRLGRTGVGAGGRDPEGAPNVVRLLVGEPAEPATGTPAETLVVLEALVDDLDPRVWPEVVASLLRHGALDAWLTPVLGKKGRAAHLLGALVEVGDATRLEEVVLRETSSLGVRRHEVGRRALPRRVVQVAVDGEPIAVKLGWQDGVVTHAQPEWDDVVAAARVLGSPAREVLARAVAAAAVHLGAPAP